MYVYVLYLQFIYHMINNGLKTKNTFSVLEIGLEEKCDSKDGIQENDDRS